ncbi:MAG: hypothetical protein WCY62_06320 [Clostridia bacterium]
MKSGSLKIVFAILILCLLLSACEDNKTDNSMDTLLIDSSNAISKEGIVVSDKGVMTYYDYDTGKQTILCTRLQCMHEIYDKDTNPDPDCPAVSHDQYQINCAFIANGKLYFATEGSINVEKGLVTTKLYKEDLNGENRVYLGEINYDFRVTDTYVFDNYVFGLINSIKIISNTDGNVNTESTLQAAALDLDTLEVTYLSKPDEITGGLKPYVYNSRLYCTFRNTQNGMYEIRIFSLKDFSLIDTISTNGYSYIKYHKENMYYMRPTEGIDEIALCKRSLKTGNENILYIYNNTMNESYDIFTVIDDYIFYNIIFYDGVNPAEDRGTYVFDMNDESITKTDFSYSGVYAVVFTTVDDEHILLKYTEKGKIVYRYMKVNDFINRSMDFIDIKPAK